MSQSVKAIPPGYHTITPNITVKDAAKAIEFYKSAFGAQEIMRMPGPGGRIMHAEMTIGDSKFMIADEMPEMGNKGPKSIGGSPVSFYLYFENVDSAWKKALQAGGKETGPLADMFWGDRTGRLEDPFGHTWVLAQHIKDLTPSDMKAGQEAFLAKMQGAHR
ncbi:MAG TPA: VOC family protein [bacterium]|jgi:uncharacterized glyoxalase superfamily protein PhnB|nr:VOC family protein [bacterium]